MSVVSTNKARFYPGLVPAAAVGAANGVAPLGADGKLASQYIPAGALGGLSFKGALDASTGAYPSSPGNGDLYMVSVAGTITGTKYTVGDFAFYSTVDSAWHQVDVSRTTDELTEGTTNLFFTAARAQAAAVINSLAASTTQAPTTSAVNTALAGKQAAFIRTKERYVLTSTDITNGYKNLAQGLLVANSMVAGLQGLGLLEESLDSGSTGDYLLTVDGGTNKGRFTWKNDFATGGAVPLVVGDVIYVQYSYTTA